MPPSELSLRFTPLRQCRDCGEPIGGRIDKLFCSDSCRTNYHNRLNSREVCHVRKINAILRKNRGILREIFMAGICHLTQDDLRRAGYDFRYFTGMEINPQGEFLVWVYEYAFRENSVNKCIGVIKGMKV